VLGFLNIFFFVFHTGLIAFNLTGWIWKRTRLANLVTLGATASSWFVLGIWYGFGYCPSTEWHWLVREKLGYPTHTYSYTKFLVDSMTGLDVSAALVDSATVILLALALAASIFTTVISRRKRRNPKE
jgi:hypothetical protein